MSKYENVFSNFILENDLTEENFERRLKEIGFVKFFNDITLQCLGDVSTEVLEQTKKNTTSAIIYCADETKEKVISEHSNICINSFYLGIICNGALKFNYDLFPNFLKDLYELRKSYKSKNMLRNENGMLIQYLIKMYINSVYGMIDNTESVISTDNDHSREYIVSTAKKVILHIVSFLLNKSIPIYYIDTDELIVSTLSKELKEELVLYLSSNIDNLIDLNISSVEFDDSKEKCYYYILGPKKMLVFDKNSSKIKGNVKFVEDDKILIKNKIYFGKTYRDFFPEYVLFSK